MATPESALAQIQSVATDFSEIYVLASKIYVRVPMSREHFKIVDQDYSIMSSTFDKNLYLTKSDIEYYSSVPVWVLSPNDYWGIVRKFTRNEDIEIDASTGIIMDPSKKPWLKVAIGHPGNLTVFKNIIQFISISIIQYSQVSANYYKQYMENMNKHIIHYEFQGNEIERNYINKLLTLLISANSDVGDMAPSIPELMFQYFGNDEVLLFDYYDVLELKAGIVVDQVFLLSPDDGYSKIRTITVTRSDNIDKEEVTQSRELLELFSQSLNGRYAVTIRSSGPWFYIHPKMIPAIKEMITVYQTIRKQNADANGGQEIPRTCEYWVAQAKNDLKYLAQEKYDNNIGLYGLAVKLLKTRQALLDKCIISTGNDPINDVNVVTHCQLTQEVLRKFIQQKDGVAELYVFPVNSSGQVIDDAIRKLDNKENMEILGRNLKRDNQDPIMSADKPWLVLYNGGPGTNVMAKALHDSINHLISKVDAAVHRA